MQDFSRKNVFHVWDIPTHLSLSLRQPVKEEECGLSSLMRCELEQGSDVDSPSLYFGFPDRDSLGSSGCTRTQSVERTGLGQVKHAWCGYGVAHWQRVGVLYSTLLCTSSLPLPSLITHSLGAEGRKLFLHLPKDNTPLPLTTNPCTNIT